MTHLRNLCFVSQWREASNRPHSKLKLQHSISHSGLSAGVQMHFFFEVTSCWWKMVIINMRVRSLLPNEGREISPRVHAWRLSQNE